MTKQIELLQARRFLPLLLTQTTGAFNDNLFKSAFIMLHHLWRCGRSRPRRRGGRRRRRADRAVFSVLGDRR